MNKILSILLITSFASSFLSAQSYDFAGGLRLGTGIGFTFKYQPIKKMTLEAIMSAPLKEEEVRFSLLAARHNHLITRGFNFYLGGGVMKGFNTQEEPDYDDPFAVLAIMGAEFNISRLNISYDVIPSYNVVGGKKDFEIQTGVSIRYVFDKKKLLEDREKNKAKRKKSREKNKKKRERAKQKRKKAKKGESDKKWWQLSP